MSGKASAVSLLRPTCLNAGRQSSNPQQGRGNAEVPRMQRYLARGTFPSASRCHVTCLSAGWQHPCSLRVGSGGRRGAGHRNLPHLPHCHRVPLQVAILVGRHPRHGGLLRRITSPESVPLLPRSQNALKLSHCMAPIALRRWDPQGTCNCGNNTTATYNSLEFLTRRFV